MSSIDWEQIRPTHTRRAVRVTTENVRVIADHFGGTVEVIQGTTRLNLIGQSGPARGWITDDGEWLWVEDEWEPADG